MCAKEKMSSLRKTISRRLVKQKILLRCSPPFNEVDMTRIMETRKQYKDKFKEIHGVNLGFMSFFAKACAIALGEWPICIIMVQKYYHRSYRHLQMAFA